MSAVQDALLRSGLTLGRYSVILLSWESIAMIERYTKSVRFEDSLRFYKPTLG